MIYTDRKYLSILTLTEDRDYVTYDELIHVLEECPSDAVYVERDGILCGLIVASRIVRNHDEKIRRVPFNKKYTYVHPEECMRVRQIFRDKSNINMLPVISEDGRLLGEYVRWNDLICRDYAGLLFKNPYVLQGLKENIQNAVLVAPTVHGGALRTKIFSRWRQIFESEGIHLRVIQHWEIGDYLNSVKYFLFTDEDGRRGLEVLNRYLYYNKEALDRSFLTITDYLYRMRQLASAHLNMSFLRALQNQGVFVLAFDFKENSNQFLAVLKDRIKKRNEAYGVDSLRPCLKNKNCTKSEYLLS